MTKLLEQEKSMRDVDRDTFTKKRNILNRLLALFEEPRGEKQAAEL